MPVSLQSIAKMPTKSYYVMINIFVTVSAPVTSWGQLSEGGDFLNDGEDYGSISSRHI